MSERIDELRTRICSLRDQLDGAWAELRRVQTEECPIKVGSVIRDKKSGNTYIVREVRFYEWRTLPLSLMVSRMRKNGEWSGSVMAIYHENYEIVA